MIVSRTAEYVRADTKKGDRHLLLKAARPLFPSLA